MTALPVIDLAALDADVSPLDAACRDWGFFYLAGHGIDSGLEARLRDEARRFFALPDEEKSAVSMDKAGRAWRGWFPLGGELTSGTPDDKEGIYFGVELPRDDPRVVAGVPLHGANLFPTRGLQDVVLRWIDALSGVGHVLLEHIGTALGQRGLADRIASDPLRLFRIFAYPPGRVGWGVGEHTDYGLLTLLGQDGPGLEVLTPAGWIDVPPLEGTLVCNLGDVIGRISAGAYPSTAHRVRNGGDALRLSYPFFFDPSWDVDIGGTTYGDYITAKVVKVFPHLMQA